MKKFFAVTVALAVLSFGSLAFARGWGGGPGYGCGGPGNGGGPGYMGRFAETDEGKKFLKETQELRKNLHDKRFELKEAYLAGDKKKAGKIVKEIDELSEKLFDKAEKAGINKRGYGRGYGRGPGYGGGPGYGCGGPGYCGGPY
jgi:hypothetical protein